MALENPPSPVNITLVPGHDAVIIAFGSMRLKEPVPPFEWAGILRDMPTNKILVRDLNKIWYLRGLPGLSANPCETRDYFRLLLDEHQIRRVIVVGGSMGGYAALLHGALLEADEVHAFGAQTFLPARKGLIFWKSVYARNWPILRRQTGLLLARDLDRSFYDLRAHLRRAATAGTVFHLYYCQDHPMDIRHARHVAGIPGVHLHPRVSGGHHVSLVMRDSGEMDVVLKNALNPGGARAPVPDAPA